MRRQVISAGLMLACAAYALWRGRAVHSQKLVKKVLVVQMAKLGDMVCTTPMLGALKKKYPSAEVWMMGSALNRELLEGVANVDGYIVFDGIWSVCKRLRRERFDAVFLAGGPDIASLSVAFLANVPLIVVPQVAGGYSPLNTLWYRLTARLVERRTHTMGQYAPREYLRLLEPLGIYTENTEKFLAFSADAGRKIDSLCTATKGKTGRVLIGIAPGAGNKVKEWPAERFAALADALASGFQAGIVIFGSARDKEEVKTMLAGISKNTPLLDLSERLSIDELKAAVATLDLFIAADTGSIYIAEAFGVPTVDIVGPVDEREQPPLGKRHFVVVPPGPRVPQLFVLNAKCFDYTEARRQAEAITVEMVFNACKTMLDRRP